MDQISKAHWNGLSKRKQIQILLAQVSRLTASESPSPQPFVPSVRVPSALCLCTHSPLLALVVMTTHICILQLIKPVHGTVPHLTLLTAIG